jgi:hypothetical protein
MGWIADKGKIQFPLLYPLPSGRDSLEVTSVQRELVEELKAQWKLLWSERFNDRVRAEGVSVHDYAIIDIEKGTVIHATKDFRLLTLKEILEKHKVENPERFVQPDLHVGGWTKFIKTEIMSKSPKRSKSSATYVFNKPKKVQPKKGGKGWLHF